jgi:predicted RNA-binding Zn-ribbon protein involved in translation (DUF1610 family)
MNETECPKCGAYLRYEPGTTEMQCPYCDSEFPIEQQRTEVKELDYADYISRTERERDLEEVIAAKCSGCGAEITLQPNVTADLCPFCATAIIPDHAVSKKRIKPLYLLPFTTKKRETNELFKRWIKSLWFAPGKLKKIAKTDEGVKGVYMPYWTYDAATITRYSGARGEYYFEPVTVMVVHNGRRVPETRMVRKIRWYPAEGTVNVSFDDVLVPASKSLPREYAESLEPWDLENLVDYDKRYLSGFLSESYQTGPRDAFEVGKARMQAAVADAIRADIGGDVQQIHSMETEYRDIKFNHLLLPVWINSYRYLKKLYRFMVNARTGEVQGERPWSMIKIALLIAAALFAMYGFAVFSQGVR